MDFGSIWCISVGSSLLKKIMILVSDVDNWGGYACVRVGGIWKSLHLSLNVIVNLNLLKKYSLQNNFNGILTSMSKEHEP